MVNKEEKVKLLGMFHTLGNQLEDKSISFRRLAFKPESVAYPKLTILNFLEAKTGQKYIYSAYDDKYFVTGIENWKTIAEKDLLNIQKYIQPTLDCDKYARMFQVKSSIIYGLNSCGMANAECIKSDGSKVKHAFNSIITLDSGSMNLYIYEPQTDCFKIFEKGNTVLDNPKWNYGNISWISL
jgi:hypothetical protein